MTDILITGEVPTDYGWKSFGSDNRHEGAAAILLRRCAEAKLREKGDGDELNLHFADRKDVEAFKLQRSLNYHSLKGKSIPALRFYMLMKDRELKEGIKYSAGVYYCDAESLCQHITKSAFWQDLQPNRRSCHRGKIPLFR